MTTIFPELNRFFEGIMIFSRLFRYLDVKPSEFKTFFNVPCATIFPPFDPASGPISIIWSADLIISSSCSTTSTVFPKFLNSLSTSISFSVSFECRPILGSSNTYKELTNELPNDVARLIR